MNEQQYQDLYKELSERSNAIHRRTISQDNYIMVDAAYYDEIKQMIGSDWDFKMIAELLASDREEDGHPAAAV